MCVCVPQMLYFCQRVFRTVFCCPLISPSDSLLFSAVFFGADRMRLMQVAGVSSLSVGMYDRLCQPRVSRLKRRAINPPNSTKTNVTYNPWPHGSPFKIGPEAIESVVQAHPREPRYVSKRRSGAHSPTDRPGALGVTGCSTPCLAALMRMRPKRNGSIEQYWGFSAKVLALWTKRLETLQSVSIALARRVEILLLLVDCVGFSYVVCSTTHMFGPSTAPESCERHHRFQKVRD